MKKERELPEPVILAAQLRGERSIAKARFVLLAILAAFGVYVFASAVAERSLASEVARPVYYIELACIVLAAAVSTEVLGITSRGDYRSWMRFVPSFIDITGVAAVHWAMASSVNPSYSFTGATVWFYLIFVAVASIRNSPASVLFTGGYAAAAFMALNTIFFSGMGNFVAGGNVYANASGSVVKLDFEDEVIKAAVILAVTGILAVVSYRNNKLVMKQVELQKIAERYAETLKKINESLERFIPREFLGFLRKENILEVELGDWTECEMTIFFLDIRDFTSLSENMSPQDNFRFLNSFLSVFGPIIRSHGGFVDKYPGDGIMALFPGSPEDAARCAIDMHMRLCEYNAQRSVQGEAPIRIGVGIHTGGIMLGTIGENERMDGTVISDAVNVASRMESLSKEFGVGVVASESILAGLADHGEYRTRYLGKVGVKGRREPISIFELYDGEPEEERARKDELKDPFEGALTAFYAQDYTRALAIFRDLSARFPEDEATQYYTRMIRRLKLA